MKRASRPDRWLDPSRGPEPTPPPARPVQENDTEDRQVSYSAGRAYLRETSRHDPDYSVTVEDRLAIEQRRLEEREFRQARNDAGLAAALELGAALRVLKGEG